MSTKYAILTQSTQDELRESVDIMLSRGWELQGGVSVAIYEEGSSIHMESKPLFSQAMTKRTKRRRFTRRGRG